MEFEGVQKVSRNPSFVFSTNVLILTLVLQNFTFVKSVQKIKIAFSYSSVFESQFNRYPRQETRSKKPKCSWSVVTNVRRFFPPKVRMIAFALRSWLSWWAFIRLPCCSLQAEGGVNMSTVCGDGCFAWSRPQALVLPGSSKRLCDVNQSVRSNARPTMNP